MTASKTTTTVRAGSALRKLSAVVILIVGIVGLGFAAATHLGVAWNGNFQAGTVMTELTCQPADDPVIGNLGDPVFVGSSTTPWAITQVEFSNISTHCFGNRYEVAYRHDGGEWLRLESATAQGTVEGSQVFADLGDLAVDIPTEFAIVFFE